MNKRIEVLDSLRGLAAATVLVHHCLVALPLFWSAYTGAFFQTHTGLSGARSIMFLLTYTPVHLLWGGHEAVMLFFVLSGFVLALPFLHGEGPGYLPYVVKRVCRIYIPYLFVSLLAIVAVAVVHGREVDALSSWFHQYWGRPISFRTVIDHLLMIGGQMSDVNPVTWSLIHEMRISLLFPLLIVFVKRFHWRWSLALALAVSLIVAATRNVVHLPQGLFDTVHYIAFFLLGATLAKQQGVVSRSLQAMGSWAKFALAVLVVFLFNWRWEVQRIPYLSNWRVSEWIMALSAVSVIALALNSPSFARLLKIRSVLWLGDVSYSLYLVHVPVLLTLVYLLGNVLSPFVAVALVPPISLLVASVLHYFVELPSVRFGKRLAEHFRSSTALSRDARKAM